MKTINKRACYAYLDPGLVMDANNGLLRAKQIDYIIRTTVKIVGHRRLLILYLYSREQAAQGTYSPAYTIFQASNTFVTYDHREEAKTKWRTAMLGNLVRDYFFTQKCAFYTAADEQRVIAFCGAPTWPWRERSDTGFDALSGKQTAIRERESLRRDHAKQRKIIAELSGLPPLPKGLNNWLSREILPAYFFYDYQKGRNVVTGMCSACGHQIKLVHVRHNAAGVCPHCERPLTMKSNGKCGNISDRVTASVVQKLRKEDALIVRIVKAYQNFPRDGASCLDVSETIRVTVKRGQAGAYREHAYHYSYGGGKLTPWTTGYPPIRYLYQENFYADTCGYLYCRNLDRALRNTNWQYCQLKAFYEGTHTQMQVAPYLVAYPKIPAIEYFVKLRLYWLATHVVYKADGYGERAAINLQGKNLKEILEIKPCDLPILQRPGAGVRDLTLLKILRAEAHQPLPELFSWLDEHDVPGADLLDRPLHYMTPHKLMRYLDHQCGAENIPSEEKNRHFRDALSDYRDYLEFCEQLQYDLTDEFVLFPRNLRQAHDQAQNMMQRHRVEKYDAQIASAQKTLKRLYQFQGKGLMVRPPQSAQEIVAEGQHLHHCVGGYAERVAKKECVILFIRREDQQDAPFFTVEVKGDRIVQIRGMRNCSPTPEVKEFLVEWEKKKKLKGAA